MLRSSRSMFLLTQLCLVLFVKSYCQPRDTLFLHNGQVLIGEIRNIQLGELTIDEVDLKMISVKVYKIKILKSIRRYRIETDDKKIYFGSLQPTERYGWNNIIADNGARDSVDLNNVFLVVPLEKSFISRLHGNLSAGFSFTKSSGDGQINVSSTILYFTRLLEFQLNAYENASFDSVGFSRDREELGLAMGYNLNRSWFLAANVNYQRNLELSIARRFQEMIGVGNKLIVRKSWQLLAITGITFNQERSTDDISSKLLFEIPLTFRYNFFKFHQPNIQISSTQSVFFSLSQEGRIRHEGSTNFSWELVRYFYLTISPYTNYDNQPPADIMITG